MAREAAKPSFRTLAYAPGRLTLLDQAQLPSREVYVDLRSVEEVARAIETMVVRGAPAIGIAAGFGVAIAAHTRVPLDDAVRRLARTRPTAVNLFWALERMRAAWAASGGEPRTIDGEALAIYDEEVLASQRIGRIGADLLTDGSTVLTHCNAGALATAELGTALAVIRTAIADGKRIQVIADETRPVLQGARLTAWELMKDGIDVTLIPDVALAHLLGEGVIDCAVVGADRIAKNGDVANKIGTRGVACLLDAHERPLYVAAPWSTVDLSLATGAQIPIEERAAEEVTHIAGVRIAPEGVRVRNPAFDVTPARWIRAILTDRGSTGIEIAAGLARIAAGGPREP